MTSNYLFVYGTLLKDFDSNMAKFLELNSKFVGEGFFNGKLYKISWYPGAVLSVNKFDKVYGHVFEILSTEKIFKILDVYEGIEDSSVNEFIRTTIKVNLANKRRINTWAYLYNLPTTHLECIKSGRYV